MNRKTIAVAVALVALLLPMRAQALENEDLLALVAMPLAVAAVSEVTDVPVSDLMDVVSLLNDAAVPPAQFIEVIRYVPVALVVQPNDGPQFVDFLRQQETAGIRGTQLVTTIEDRFQAYDLEPMRLTVDRPRVVDVRENFVPRVVRERLAEAKQHPHGGPPGQLKKVAGVQTGAEIVHGSRPAPHVRNLDVEHTSIARKLTPAHEVQPRGNEAKKVEKPHAAKPHGNPHADVAHGGGHGHDKGSGGHGNGKGQKKGKG